MFVFSESMNELLKLGIFFHSMMKPFLKKFTQTIVLCIKFNRIGSISRSLFIVNSVPEIV